MNAPVDSPEWVAQVEGTVWRLLAASRDDNRSAIIERDLNGYNDAARGLYAGHVLGELLSMIDGLVTDHPQSEQLRVVIESKADLANILDGLGDL